MWVRVLDLKFIGKLLHQLLSGWDFAHCLNFIRVWAQGLRLGFETGGQGSLSSTVVRLNVCSLLKPPPNWGSGCLYRVQDFGTALPYIYGKLLLLSEIYIVSC